MCQAEICLPDVQEACKSFMNSLNISKQDRSEKSKGRGDWKHEIW